MKTLTLTANFDPRNLLELSEVMHENKKVIQVISEKESISISEAELLFSDTLKFLFLCSIAEIPLSPNPRLDIGWHHFILSTRNYVEFCEKAFGAYIHHSPFTIDDKKKIISNPYKATYEIAKEVFQNLSENWEIKATADCCSGGNCSNSGACSHCQEE